jgi:hypothetical protein
LENDEEEVGEGMKESYFNRAKRKSGGPRLRILIGKAQTKTEHGPFNPQKLREFIAYFQDFYGAKGIYPETLPNLKRVEILEGISILALSDHEFGGGDTFDREKVRDAILLHLRRAK